MQEVKKFWQAPEKKPSDSRGAIFIAKCKKEI